MADRIEAVLDHVAIAVADWSAAEQRWREQLGGGRCGVGDNPVFVSRQLRFANGAKLELLTPPAGAGPDNFVQRFLDRFGSGIHHLTFKVADLHGALSVLESAGLDAVDVRDDVEYWKEAFLRPSQVGGVVVQIAQTPLTDDDWAAFTGFTREPARAGAAELLGPTLRAADLDSAARIWTVLGGAVQRSDAGLQCSWPGSPLDVVVEHGRPNGARHLRMRGSGPLDATQEFGPAVTDVG